MRKAAILLVLLGEEAASLIFRNLARNGCRRSPRRSPNWGHRSCHRGQHAGGIPRLALTQEYLAQGGRHTPRLLVKAFGEDGANLLEQVARAQELSASKLDSLQKADPQQLAKFLEGEHPQTIALILAHLDSKQASALLMKLPEETRRSRKETGAAAPVLAGDGAEGLRGAAQAPAVAGRTEPPRLCRLQGSGRAAEPHGPGGGKVILETIEREDPKLAMGIRNLMFTFDDLLGVPETGIRELLAQTRQEDAGDGAKRGAGRVARPHLQDHVVARRGDVERRHGVLGPVRARDVTKAQQEVVALARKLEGKEKWC